MLGDKDAAGLKRLAAGLGDAVETLEMDVSRMADCEALVDLAVSRFDGIDVLVNDAGVDHLGKLDEGDFSAFSQGDRNRPVRRRPDEPRRDHASACGQGLHRQHLVGVGSCGDWNHSFYCAAKVRSPTSPRIGDGRGEAGVRVNAVNPSLTYTALTAA